MIHQPPEDPRMPHAAHLRPSAKIMLPNWLAIHTSDPRGPNSCLPPTTGLWAGLAQPFITLEAGCNYSGNLLSDSISLQLHHGNVTLWRITNQLQNYRKVLTWALLSEPLPILPPLIKDLLSSLVYGLKFYDNNERAKEDRQGVHQSVDRTFSDKESRVRQS